MTNLTHLSKVALVTDIPWRRGPCAPSRRPPAEIRDFRDKELADAKAWLAVDADKATKPFAGVDHILDLRLAAIVLCWRPPASKEPPMPSIRRALSSP